VVRHRGPVGRDGSASGARSSGRHGGEDGHRFPHSGCTKGGDVSHNSASDTGVTVDTITIGLAIPDLDGLRAAGISLPATLTNAALFARLNSRVETWNAAGGINGRQIEVVALNYDPTKPATQEAMCAKATVDEELLLVVASTGLTTPTVRCLTGAGMLTIFGEFVGQAEHDTGLVVTVAPPSEAMARAGTQTAVAEGVIATGTKVGILAGNGPEQKAAGAESERVLRDAGYETQVVEVNTLQGDPGAINQESGAAAGTFRAGGVGHVMMLLPFSNQAGFYDNAQGLAVTVLDVISGNCTPFGASRTPAAAVGATCVALYDNQVTADGEIKPDSEFEAECRTQFEQTYAGQYPSPSSPGVPAGQVLELADGTKLSSDYDVFSCNTAQILKGALDGSGVNPTRTSVYDAALALGDIPLAGGSNGQGTLGPDKTYAANFVQQVRLTKASVDTPRDPVTGTFNGCPAPVNCWVPIDGEWFPIRP